MSLVDYASSSEDEEDAPAAEAEIRVKGNEHKDEYTKPDSHNQNTNPSLHQQSENASQSSTPSIEKLPDASLLLNSPSFASHQIGNYDHSSRVAAAMAESASRKRESIGASSSYPRSKLPRGNLTHSKNIPETVGGVLVPPQLRGRSNVVTEDIGKLFVRRNSDPAH